MPGSGLLAAAMRLCGIGFCLVYPLALVWPTGWKWHHGAANGDPYFCMIAGVYATLGLFLILGARQPRANLSLVDFAIWSSLVHSAIMAWSASLTAAQFNHFLGDIPALLLAALLLGGARWRAGRSLDPTLDQPEPGEWNGSKRSPKDL